MSDTRYLTHERFEEIARQDDRTTNIESSPVDNGPAQPAKIVFDAAQQEKVNQLIRDAQGRAARELRAELDRTRAELDAARTNTPKADLGANELATQVAELRAE